MKSGKFLVSLYNENGVMVNVYSASSLEEAEYFAIAHIKAGKDNTTKQNRINEATVIGCSQGKIIMYSMFKKEENS